jgi:hypothetical protein
VTYRRRPKGASEKTEIMSKLKSSVTAYLPKIPIKYSSSGLFYK